MTYANHHGYSDINPHEIVRRVSDKTLEIREMDAVRDDSYLLVWDGYHCVNQQGQKWEIIGNPANRVIRIRLGKQGWRDRWGNTFLLANAPKKFYDFNF